MTERSGVDAVERFLEPPFEIVLSLPPGWVELPVDGSETALIAERAQALPPEARAVVDQVLVSAAAALSEAAVVFAAAYALFEDGAGLRLLVVMTVMLEEFPASSVGADELRTAAESFAGSLVDIDLVDLPLGPTVRGHRIVESDAGDGKESEFSTLYFTPLPGRDFLSVVTFSSPQASLRRALTPLFDDIAATLRFRWRSAPSGG
jgi:hypothetical protein